MSTESSAPLHTLEALAAYLAAAFDSADTAVLSAALATAAEAAGTTHLAAAAGIPQADLRQAFANGTLSIGATLAIMKVIDLHLDLHLPDPSQ